MCTIVAAMVVAGGLTAGGGIMQAKAKHEREKAAARRQNLINELSFRNEFNQKARADQLKADKYTRELEAQAAAQQTAVLQIRINQMERDRVSTVAQQQLKEKGTESAFISQEKLAAQIAAQGQVLAGAGTAGQSLLLTMMDTERQLGMQEAQLTASMEDANTAYRLQEYGFDLEKYSADTTALNKIPGAPQAEYASFGPVRLPKVEGPSGLGLMGGIISSLGSGVSAGMGAGKSAAALGWS